MAVVMALIRPVEALYYKFMTDKQKATQILCDIQQPSYSRLDFNPKHNVFLPLFLELNQTA